MHRRLVEVDKVASTVDSSAPRWWALWVKAGREKQLMETLKLRLERQGVSDLIEEFWVPSKRIRAWNPK